MLARCKLVAAELWAHAGPRARTEKERREAARQTLALMYSLAAGQRVDVEFP